jgi:HEAT repeat protein
MLQTALVILIFPALQEDPRGLVEQLRSDSVVDRDRAAKRLLEMGDAARPELEKAAKDPDPEVASRAARILRVFAIRGLVPPRLKKASPGIEDQLAADHDRLWTEAFFAVAGDRNGKPLTPPVEPADLDFLVVRAFRGAATENERYALSQLAGDRHLRSAIPELLRLLADPSFKVQHAARYALVDLDAREAAPELLTLVGGESVNLALVAQRLIVELEAKEAVPGLVELLRSERDHARANAAAALEELGTIDQATALRPLLRDRSETVCRAAARALGVFGSKESVPDLLVLLRDGDRDVQSAAAFALGKLRAPEAVPDLVAALASPGKVDAREEIAVALGELGAKEALPSLLRLLEDKNFQAKAEVLPVVARLGGGAASPQIVACLKHEDADVREAAIEAARALKIKGLGPALIGLLEDTSDGVWQRAAEAIAESGAAEVEARLQAIAMNETVREGSRRAAILALGWGGVRTSIPFLRKQAVDPKLPQSLVLCAAHALGDLGAKEAAPELRALLGSKDSELRTAAIGALARAGVAEAIPELRKALADPDGSYDARRAAATALGALGDREGIPFLRKALETGDTFAPAALALAELGDRESAPAILEGLEYDDEEDLKSAADALARLDPAAGAAAFKKRLQDPKRKIRAHAAVALCRIGSREGVPVLLEEARFDRRLSLFSLNAVRLPIRWKTLRDRTAAWILPGGSISTERLLRLTAGVEVDAGDVGYSSWVFGNDLEQGWRPAIHVIEEYEEDVILEEGPVRLVSRGKQLRFWEAWWKREASK